MDIKYIKNFKSLKLKNITYPKDIPCIQRLNMIYNDNKKSIDKFCKEYDLDVTDTLNKFIKICKEKEKQKEEKEKEKEKQKEKLEKQNIILEQERKRLEKIQDLPTIKDSIRNSIKNYVRPSVTKRISKK
jgi:hypothetical protein